MALNGSRNVASTPQKLQRSLSLNSLSTMSKDELKTIAEQARNREEDLQLAAKLGMELQREVEDKTEKLREMETLLNQLRAETSKREKKMNSSHTSSSSSIFQAETKESDEDGNENEDDDSDIEKEDDLIQFFRNHLITSLHQTELTEASPSPMGRSISAEKSFTSPITTPTTLRSMVFPPTSTPKPRNSIIKKKRFTEEQIKSLSPHQLFVEYKRDVRNRLRELQEKVGTKEEEIAKMREHLLAMGTKNEDLQHKKLIIQRLQDELEQTQLRAAQREIELKAEMRRLVALSTPITNNSTPSSNTYKTASNSVQKSGKRGASLNFSEVSSDSEQEEESESKENSIKQNKRKSRDQLHLTLNLPDIYAANNQRINNEDGAISPPVLSPSLTRHIYRLPSISSSTIPTSSSSIISSSSSTTTNSDRVELEYPIIIQQESPEKRKNYKRSYRTDSMDQLQPLIKGGGIHEGEAGCWDKFQGWNILTYDVITTSNFLSDWWLWFYRLIATIAVVGVIAFHYGHRVETDNEWWKWFTYLTNWNQLIVAFYFSFALVYSSQRDDPGESSSDKLLTESFGRRLTFVLFELAFATTITVVVMFWSVIFKPGSHDDVNLALDILTHGLILFWLLIELFINRITFPWTHILWELVVVLSYLLFIYEYTIHKEPIYEMVTFKTTKSTEVVVGAIVLALGGFSLGYALTQIRDYCCGHGERLEKRYSTRSYQPPTLTENQRLTVADLRHQSSYEELPKRDDVDEY